MCIDRGFFAAGAVGPAPATFPIFIMASIILLFFCQDLRSLFPLRK